MDIINGSAVDCEIVPPLSFANGIDAVIMLALLTGIMCFYIIQIPIEIVFAHHACVMLVAVVNHSIGEKVDNVVLKKIKCRICFKSPMGKLP